MPQRMDGLRKEQDRDAEETGVRTPLDRQILIASHYLRFETFCHLDLDK